MAAKKKSAAVNAAVKLDNGHEVWLPAERISRPGEPLRQAS